MYFLFFRNSLGFCSKSFVLYDNNLQTKNRNEFQLSVKLIKPLIINSIHWASVLSNGYLTTIQWEHFSFKMENLFKLFFIASWNLTRIINFQFV